MILLDQLTVLTSLEVQCRLQAPHFQKYLFPCTLFPPQLSPHANPSRQSNQVLPTPLESVVQSRTEYSRSSRPSKTVTKESSESLPRQATRPSLSLWPSPKSFVGTRPPRCVLPLPFIVVAVVVERLNVVAKRQSHAHVAVVISVRTCDSQSSSLIFSNLVARFQ